ncbi:MAG: PKD domain-containing protein [candidate division Zixibacteria bacterium]|nr:PKD domain-containing protein [candidate division Zixibacteria bacterium]
MMNNTHTSNSGRVLFSLLLIVGLISFFAVPAQAGDLCNGECDSYLVDQNHDVPEGDVSLCDTTVANFCACPRVGCESLDVTFVDWSLGCVDSWEWNFGDPNSGSDDYSDYENPTHFYSSPGSYTVTLTITGAAGTSTKIKQDYIVVRGLPTADFTSSTQGGCIPMTVQFQDRSDDAATWDWDFGDGQTSTDRNPSHDYNAPGTYTVTLTVHNECGKDEAVKEDIIIVGQEPTADFTSSHTEACDGETVTFTNLSTLADSYLWDFGDGTTSTVEHPTKVYTVAGGYTVSLTASNACGDDTETKTEYITVLEGPTADFTADETEICTGEIVNFTDLSSNADSLLWDFGDGTTSTSQNPSHTYTAPGLYTVTLTAYNFCGEDVEEKPNYVSVVNEPVAGFSADTTIICPGQTVNFTDESQYASSWQWYFGDGGSSIEQNPSHTYNTPGQYTVELIVRNACGDDDHHIEYYITVRELPTADFTLNDDEGCAPASILFTDRSVNATSWEWNFGDGTTPSNDQNPIHEYTIPGTYNFTLIASNDCGSDTTGGSITIYGAPEADFRANTDWSCIGRPVSFSDMSTNADDWMWDFGDGTSSQTQNPRHSYTSVGTYTVTLTVTGRCGEDSEVKTNFITIMPAPEADFTADVVEGCAPMTVLFTDNSVDAEDYDWDFGGQGTSIEINPQFTFTTPGIYRVVLTVENPCGPSTKDLYITVNGPPLTQFTANDTYVCIGDTVTFTDQSIDAETWQWYFGDGGTSTEQNPTHVYTQEGGYDVTLVTENACGEDDEHKPYYIGVAPNPTAEFESHSYHYCSDNEVYFDNYSVEATSYHWDFGDGNTSTAYEPQHTYTSAGDYTVTLIAYNSCGADTISRTEEVIIADLPIADFVSDDSSVCPLEPVQFTNTSAYEDTWEWNFGDGETSYDENPSHYYTNPGRYTITLTVDNQCGEDTETKSHFIEVFETPTADFTFRMGDNCDSGLVSFTNNSRYVDTWHWDFGDGTPYSSEYSPTHAFTSEGDFTVTLSVDNPCGDDEITKTVTIVIRRGPTADFSADLREICEGGTVAFTNLSTDADDYGWSFGDGSTSQATNPSHQYNTPGIYRVSLLATNDCGDDFEEKYQYITVNAKPVADFTTEGEPACIESDIYFTDLSTDADSLLWNFGDGTTSTDQNPTHAYSQTGRYTVSLTAYNDCGEDTETKEEYIYIIDPPTAGFTYEVTPYCGFAIVDFTNQSTDAMSWLWNFGDGTTSIERHPDKQYSNSGSYTVTLTANNNCGTDVDTQIVDVTILPFPTADFTADYRNICQGETVNFTNLSTDASGYTWNFGDGGSSGATNPSHTYTTAGVYTVTLRAINECGPDTETKQLYITVSGDPVADFTASNRELCIGAEVTFTDNSDYPISWLWDFGDGTTSIEQNPIHSYNSAGSYTVSLTVTNACGDDTETKTEFITVLPLPIADFGSEVTTVCVDNDVYLYNNSQYSTSWLWDFGDGDTSPTQHPTHTYSAPGSYTIKLIAYNDCGSDSMTKVDYITIVGGPTADFSGTPLSGSAPLVVAFTDLSSSNFQIYSRTWHFGDGSSADSLNPTHTYTAAGTYTVSLIVTDECGTDTTTKEAYVEVSDDCNADFIAEPTEGCVSLQVYFGGIEIGACDISSWTWDFGDPNSGADNTGAGKDVEHTYAEGGVYTVTMTAADADGDIVMTKSNFVTVIGAPEARFIADPLGGAAPLRVNFLNQSTSATGTITSYLWDFGDPQSGSDNISTQPNMTYHIYDTEGIYTVTLIVANECFSDTATMDITVAPAILITKQVDKLNAREGEELEYTITIRNNSFQTIDHIMVSDTIQDLSSYVSGSITTGGLYDPNTNVTTWDFSSFGPRSAMTMTFKVLLDGPYSSFPSVVRNQAFAEIDDIETLATAARSFASNIVETIVDETTGGELGLLKQVDIALASPGDVLTYTITVTNEGSTTADNVMIYDAIPDLTSYVANSISAGGTYNSVSDSLEWNLGTITAFASQAVTFQVTIDSHVQDNIEIPNTALATSSIGGHESNRVLTAVSLVPLVVTKTTDTPSGMVGDLMRFTIKVENFSGDIFTDVHVLDTMPGGLFIIDGTSLLDGSSMTDPTGSNPYEWTLGDLPAGGVMTLEYSGIVSASAYPGINENVARAQAFQGTMPIYSNRAVARVNIISQTLAGSIRGIILVDCDGDGVADIDDVPHGMDVYLDDGSQSKVNEKGMFYFSTVRAGERVVALDTRDLDGYYVPEDAQSSVFAHVHEVGESYVIFRVCPEYARLDIRKEASIIPIVKVTKRATLYPEQDSDSLGVLVDYQIDIKSNGLADPTDIMIVDSFPDNTELILHKKHIMEPQTQGNRLIYNVTAAKERLFQSAYYSLRDSEPGVRRFLTNKIHIEGEVAQFGGLKELATSEPANVVVGPFLLVPPQDINVTLTPALFVTSMADLQDPAMPLLEAVADSIAKYADADVMIEGHTDYRPIKTEQFPSNWELGEARAKAVADWLVDMRSIDRHRLESESFAATKPVVQVGQTSKELQPNRRTEVIIKATMAGVIDMDMLHPEDWESSTWLALAPNKFDTLFEAPASEALEVDLDDSWEVALTIENTSAIDGENVILKDILPDGAMYLENSAMLDGELIEATITGKEFLISIARIVPLQKIELRYRIKAIEGTTPAGGGAASVEVMTSQNQPIIQISNEVIFQ